MKLINSNKRKFLRKGEVFFLSKPTFVGKFIIRANEMVVETCDEIKYGTHPQPDEIFTIANWSSTNASKT